MRILALTLLLLTMLLPGLHADDWPMWKHNAGRTAVTPTPLPTELHLQWVRQLPPARQAWKDKSNFMLFFDVSYEPIVAGKLVFVGSMNSDSVTAYDTDTGAEKWRFYTGGPVRFAPVAHKGKLFVASDDGCLYCLDATSGKLAWKLRGGPTDHKVLGNERLIGMWPFRGAPVIHNDVLYCAAGIWPFMGTFIYALDPDNGKVIWKNSGNGSRWIVQQHGAPSFSGATPQGYLAASGNMLLIPSSRSTPAAFDTKTGAFLYNNAASRKFGKGAGGYAVSIAGKTFASRPGLYHLDTGKPIGRIDPGIITPTAYHVIQGRKLISIPLNDEKSGTPKKAERDFSPSTTGEVGRAYIKAGDSLYCARNDGTVSALAIDSVDAPEIRWQGKIEGNAWTMLAADDKLFVVSTEGSIFCFGATQQTPLRYDLPRAKPLEAVTKWSATVDAVAKKVGSEGYCVCLGIGSGSLISELLRKTSFHVIVLDADSAAVTRFRQRMDHAGLYGERLSAIVANPLDSGLPPYLASAIVAEKPLHVGPEELKEVFRILRPYGGTAFLPLSEDALNQLAAQADLKNFKVSRMAITREGALPGSASWSHQYCDAANSVVSKDKLVKPPFGLLWFGGPTNDEILPRHGHGPNPEVAGGRIFIEGPDILRALDAYTGRRIWERRLEGVGHYYDNTGHHPGANNIGSNYASFEDAVYILYKEKCLKLDAATGKTVSEFTLPIGEDGAPIFGSIRVEGDYLVITSAPLGVEPRVERIPVKDGKDITLEAVKNLSLDEGKGVSIQDANGIYYWKMKMEKDGDKMVAVRDGKRVSIREKGASKTIEFGQGIRVGSCKRITIAEGKGISVEAAEGVTFPTGQKIDTNVRYASASRTLAVLDRNSGKILWSRDAVHGFRHNSVIASGDTVYCIDKLSPKKEAFLARRGIKPPETTSLLALDIRTGKVKWQKKEDVFGTWLGYSSTHDVLIQGGSAFRDRASDEVGTGVVAYRGKDGKVLWKDLERKYAGPLMLRHREILTNGGGGSAWDLFTGESTGWSWRRMYGCNTAIGGEHILAFRSGAAGYYDLARKGGTGNLGGFKSGCTSNLIPGDGLLTAPDYTRTCSCSYPNQTSLALVHMPQAEIWTFGATETPGRMGINFGAPGDRVSNSGTLWSEFPAAGSPDAGRKVTADGTPFRHHSMLFSGEDAWIASSGLEAVSTITIATPTNNTATARLVFAEPRKEAGVGDRVFNVSLGDKQVLKALDIVKEAGASRRALVKEIHDIPAGEALTLSFAAIKGEPLICGVEIITGN